MAVLKKRRLYSLQTNNTGISPSTDMWCMYICMYIRHWFALILFEYYIAFVGTKCGKETQAPVAIYRTVYLFGIGLASLLAFMPVKINQIVICTSIVVFALLHLLINRISK